MVNKKYPEKLLKNIQFNLQKQNRLLDMGAKLIRQAAGLTNDTAGDGTTTSIILASELLQLII